MPLQVIPLTIRAIRVIRGSTSALAIIDDHSRCSVAQFELRTQQDQLRKSRSRLTLLRRAVWLGSPRQREQVQQPLVKASVNCNGRVFIK